MQSTEQLQLAIEKRNIMLKRFIFNMLYRLAFRDGSGLDEFRCLSDLVAEQAEVAHVLVDFVTGVFSDLHLFSHSQKSVRFEFLV